MHGFFVAGEFALVAVDRTRVEHLAQAEHAGAISTLEGLKNLSFQLSGAQLGITITSLLVGFIAEDSIAQVLEPVLSRFELIPKSSSLAVAVGLALAAATALEMVVAELLPKNLAVSRPEAVAFLAVTPLRAVNRLLRPVIVFLNESANWTVKRLGIEPREELIPVRSLEELDLLIHSSRLEGALPEEDFALLARSIDFGDKTAADALVPRVSVVALKSDDTIIRMAQVARKSGYSRFPVYASDLDDIVGIAYLKDGYATLPEKRDSTPVSEIMKEALVVPESRPLHSLLLEMRRERKHLAVVLDEYGGTAGIVTLEDILEEIVGEIEDEYDPSAARERAPRSQGVHILSGLLHRSEVEEAIGLVMPEGHYETLAGFLLDLFDRIPEQGDQATYDGWELKVLKMDGRRIDEIACIAPDRTQVGEQP